LDGLVGEMLDRGVETIAEVFDLLAPFDDAQDRPVALRNNFCKP